MGELRYTCAGEIETREDAVRASWTGRSRSLVAGLVLFLLALAPRAFNLDTFITIDEPTWAERTLRFMAAKQRGDWAGTFQAGHPGVITMWTASVLASRSPLNQATQARLIEQTAVEEPGSYDMLAQIVFATRIGVGLLTAAGVAGIFWLARQLWGDRIAFLGATLVAFDPFYLAHSRLLHLDALLTTFMTISVLGLIVAISDKQLATNSQRRTMLVVRHGSFVVSAVAAGLAFLSKSTALFILPFVGVALVIDAWQVGQALRARLIRLVGRGLVWAGLAAAIYVALWPAMWVDPVGTLSQVFGKAYAYAKTPHENGNFFLGEPRGDPGPLFYPVTLAFRLTPLTLLGIPVGLVILFRNWSRWPTQRSRPALLGLLTYAVLFALLLTFEAKKGDRYLLPIYPALDLLVAASIVGLTDFGRQRAEGRRQEVDGSEGQAANHNRLLPTAFRFLPSVTLLAQAIFVLPYHPYDLAYFNPVLGGGQAAMRLVEVGLGEGMELAGRYLSQQPDATEVAVWVVPAFAPYFPGRIQSVAHYNPATADYVVLYVSQLQRHLFDDVTARYQQQPPEAILGAHGIDYAWVYRNRTYEAPLAYLATQVNPATDVIVFDEPSLVARHYAGPAPSVVLQHPTDEPGLVEELRAAAAGRQRFWYVTYPEGRGDRQGLIGYQLATHAYQELTQNFPDVRIVSYRLPPTPEFQSAQVESLREVDFGAALSLRRIGLDRRQMEWARGLGVVTEWSAVGPLDNDYVVFLHLEDAQGRLWGQVDQPLRDAVGKPTSEWTPGQPVTAHYSLAILPGTPPGRYTLKLGIYQYPTGQRLGLRTAGILQGTEYNLGDLTVVPSPLIPPVESLDISLPVRGEVAGQLRLLGLDRLPTSVRPGETLPLTLFWQAAGTMETQYSARIQLRDQTGTPIADLTLPLAASYPTDRWRPGELIRGRYTLPLKPEAPDGEAQLVVQLLDATGGPAAAWSLGRVQVEAIVRRFDLPPIPYPQRATLGDGAVLLGYDLETFNVERSTLNMQLTLYWQARAPIAVDYTVFAHLLGPDGRVWGQVDRMPVEGHRPTSGWLPGEVLVDRYVLPVAADAPPGVYRIEVGLYEAASGQRLPVQDADGKLLPDDRVLLDSQIQVP